MSSIQFPGRNDPCWCGSGAKYKKCHMDFDRRLHEFELAGAEVPPHSLLKTSEQLKGIRESAKINIAVLDYVAEHIRAGITTEDIDKWVYEQTVLRGGIPAPLNYEGYPKSVCTSIDEVVCHGIPSPDRVLKEGDIINVDCSTILNGYFSDSSRMFCIGEVSPEKKRLVEVAKQSLDVGLSKHPEWQLVFRASGDFIQAKGQELTEELVESGIEFDVIFSENDNMTYGAIDALKKAGLTPGRDVIIVSFDASNTALHMILSGEISLDVECNPLHGPRVRRIIEQLENGKTPEKRTFVEEDLFDISNLTEEIISVRGY